MRNKLITLLGVLVMMFGVAGCTTAQEQSVVNAVNAICLGLETAATAAITVVSSITGATTALTITNVVSADLTAVCTEMETNLTSLISTITGNGGTATVTVTSSSTTSAMHHLGAVLRTNFPRVKVINESNGTIKFVIPPSNNVLGL